MSIVRVSIKNYKSIIQCDISLCHLNMLIGENGAGKTNIVEAIRYAYSNMTENNLQNTIFNENNRFSNEVIIEIHYDLSHFLKISKSHYGPMFPYHYNDDTKKHSGYYKRIAFMALEAKDQTICLRMHQIKNRGIKWSHSYEDRFIIKSLFPLYFLNARDIEMANWDTIWNILGDLSKVSNSDRRDLERKIGKAIETNNIQAKIDKIHRLLSESQIGIKKSTAKDFASNLVQLNFQGTVFENRGKQLSFFSTGTNSLNYIALMLNTITLMARTKLKEPIVIIDEPELNLHHLYIDKLGLQVIANSDLLTIVLSSHSARLTKYIIKSSQESNIYNVKLYNKNTTVCKMRKFTQYSPISRYRVIDDHANAYFSKAIVFVEGESELELFSNPYLNQLFENLSYIDIFKASADSIIRDIMLPTKTKTPTPYLVLVDLDAVLKYSPKVNRFYPYKYLKPEGIQKEHYVFINKQHKNASPYALRNRVYNMASKCKFHYYKPYYSCKDRNFKEFKNAINRYLSYYSTYVCDTTIEGCLVSHESVDYVLSYLKKNNSEEHYNAFIGLINALYPNDRLNAIRLAFNGKTDFMLKLDTTLLSTDEKKIINDVRIDSKAKGWISDFLELYFAKGKTGTEQELFATFKNNYSKNKSEIFKEFCHDFPELSMLFVRVNNLIS